VHKNVFVSEGWFFFLVDVRAHNLHSLGTLPRAGTMTSSSELPIFYPLMLCISDVNGGVVVGRNMDGEIDLRKATVSHFIIYAVESSGLFSFILTCTHS
jgi:hypothetical protein